MFKLINTTGKIFSEAMETSVVTGAVRSSLGFVTKLIIAVVFTECSTAVKIL